MPILTTKHASQTPLNTFTREDLRSELQEFLLDVRREVSEQVCQSLLPELRQLLSEHRPLGSLRADRSASAGSSSKSYLSIPKSGPPKYSQSSLEAGAPRRLTVATSSGRGSVDGVEKLNFFSMNAERLRTQKAAISLTKMQKEAQKLTTAANIQDEEYKSYTLLTRDSAMEDAQSNRLSVEDQSNFKKVRLAVKSFVRNETFDRIISLAVLANAISLGYDTQYWAEHRDEQNKSPITTVTETIFCVLFTTELSFRVFAYGCDFFQMDTWCWNILDTLLVALQLSEQILRLVSMTTTMDLGILRLLRVLRIVRVTRLVRSFHLFDDLRVLVSSVMSSASSLGWSLVLLGILMYIFSLTFLQIILNAGETEHVETLRYWFGSLYRTYFTMFECIVGGVSWDEVASPLMDDIGPFACCLFSLYIACSMFAMMNLLTGVFVDTAMKVVREDKDVVLAKRIRDLFLGRDADEKDQAPLEITWGIFLQKLKTNVMQDYLKQINVEITQGKALFSLLDADDSGSIDSDEIVAGCLKLRGPARALDLAMLSRDVHSLTVIVNEVKLYVVKIMEEIFTYEGDDIGAQYSSQNLGVWSETPSRA